MEAIEQYFHVVLFLFLHNENGDFFQDCFRALALLGVKGLSRLTKRRDVNSVQHVLKVHPSFGLHLHLSLHLINQYLLPRAVLRLYHPMALCPRHWAMLHP